jgi:hypothetical protein
VAVPRLWKAIEQRVGRDVAAGVAEAEAFAAHEFATVTNAVAGAAAELPHIAELPFDELKKLLDGTDLAKLGGLLLAVPLLNSLVNALVREAGLGEAACRQKNAGICGTDPLQWASLLGALVPIGLAFDLEAIVGYAGSIAGEVETLVQQAA